MNRIVKTALLWLLALALPVQGWAAATQMSCVPAMHQTAHASAEMSHDMQAPGHHAMHADAHERAVGDTQDHSSAASVSAKHADAKCSVCAACYVGMVMLPSTSGWLPLPVGSMPVVITPTSSFFGHIPDGIKRPPKSVLV